MGKTLRVQLVFCWYDTFAVESMTVFHAMHEVGMFDLDNAWWQLPASSAQIR